MANNYAQDAIEMGDALIAKVADNGEPNWHDRMFINGLAAFMFYRWDLIKKGLEKLDE